MRLKKYTVLYTKLLQRLDLTENLYSKRVKEKQNMFMDTILRFGQLILGQKKNSILKKAIRCIELNVVYRNVKEAAKSI